MAKKRITELTEATSVKSDHYIPVDHGSDGTQKMSMSTLIDSTLTTSGKAADAKATGDNIDLLDARMDTFTSLPSGSTSGDAELMDIRVGADGTTYQSAGSAVREQISGLTDSVGNLDDLETTAKTDLVSAINEAAQSGGSGTGLTEDIKQALHDCFENLAWINANGQTLLNALDNALWPPANLASISCVYTQSGTVYDTDTLDSLKSDLVVTAHFDDSSTRTVTTYTLSGTLTEGTSTITVSYGGKTATFNVTVTHNVLPLYDWDFTQSLVDSVGNVTAVLTGCTRDSSGVNFTAANQAIMLGSEKIDITDKTYILDFPSMTLTDGGSNHARLLCSDSADADTGAGAAGFIYRHLFGWTVYDGSAWGASTFNKTTYPIDFFNGKRLKIYIGTDLKLKVSYAEIGSDTFTEIGTLSSALQSTYQNGYLVVGGTGSNNFSPVTVSRIKIWEGEV